MEYVPYEELAGRPSIVVDGTPAPGTALTLSHWVGSGTPEALADDLSTQIVFRYLDTPDLHVQAEAVSNNHFDQDGVCGIFAVLNPDEALPLRERVTDVASAGDFGVYRERDAARVAMTLAAFEDEDRSPLPASTFAQPYTEQAAAFHRETLALLPQMLRDPLPWKDLWEDEDARLERSEAALRRGEITIQEHAEIDLAVVRVAGSEEPHEFAINSATQRHRILTLSEGLYRLQYRYETWVRFVSRPTMPRMEMRPIADRLGERDTVRWRAGSIGSLTPTVEPEAPSTLPPDQVAQIVTEALRSAI